MRNVAAEPASQARFFQEMETLFSEHFLGVDVNNRKGHPDGLASQYGRGVYGPVRAYFAPVETQGRGGLHFHMCVWISQPLRAQLLDRLRRGADDALLQKLLGWRKAVLEKVASMQFDSTDEVGRQLGLPKQDIRRLPFSEADQKKYKVAGNVETDDPGHIPADPTDPNIRCQDWKKTFPGNLEEPPREAPENAKWATEPPSGARQIQQFIPVTEDMYVDPHCRGPPNSEGKVSHLKPWQFERLPQTGACVSLMPQWRRKPRYITMADGRAAMCMAEKLLEDAHCWATVCYRDVRQLVIGGQIHQCRPTCFKNKKGGGKFAAFASTICGALTSCRGNGPRRIAVFAAAASVALLAARGRWTQTINRRRRMQSRRGSAI